MPTLSYLFEVFINLGDAAVKRLVDMYNAGELEPNERLVLEAIEALE